MAIFKAHIARPLPKVAKIIRTNSGGILGERTWKGIVDADTVQFTEAGVFQVLAASPVSARTVRVFFGCEPKAISQLGNDDALNVLNWTVALQGGTTPEFTILGVIGPTFLTDPVLGSVWFMDIKLNGDARSGVNYTAIAGSSIVAVDGSVMPASPDDRADFPGLGGPRTRGVVRPITAAGGQRFG